MIKHKVNDYLRLMRVASPIGYYLLLWPTLWALWLAAQGYPSGKIVLIFLAGVVIMRSAGDVINDIADRHFDGQVERTRNRPLAQKKISVVAAFVLFAFLCGLALLLVLCLNPLTQVLAVIAVILAVLYPFAKRYTYYPQVVLGATWYFSILMAFSAELNQIPWSALLVYLTGIVWAVVYDTCYAMADREDDLKIGIKSTAILFGERDRVIIGLLQVVVLLLLVLIGVVFHLNHYYYLSLVIAAGFSLYQQYLIKDRDPQKCLQAFCNNHYFGLVVFLGIAGGYYLR